MNNITQLRATLDKMRATLEQTMDELGTANMLLLRLHSIQTDYDGYRPNLVLADDGTLRFEHDEDEIHFRLKYL